MILSTLHRSPAPLKFVETEWVGLVGALLSLPWFRKSVYCKNAYFTEKLNIQRMIRFRSIEILEICDFLLNTFFTTTKTKKLLFFSLNVFNHSEVVYFIPISNRNSILSKYFFMKFTWE